GIAMLLGVVLYRATGHWLGAAGIEPAPASAGQRLHSRRLFVAALVIVAGVIAATTLGAFPLNVVQVASLTGALMVATAVLFFGGVLLFGGLSAAERKRTAVIGLFLVAAAVFWAGYEQAG